MQKAVLLTFLFILVLALSLSGAGERNSYSVTFGPVSNLRNTRMVSTPRGHVGYTLSDLSEVAIAPQRETELYLSFSQPAGKTTRDDMKYYTVRKASFRHVKGHGSFGKGSAFFYHHDHGVEITTEKNQWFGRCKDLGSFSIEFRIKPSSLRDGSVILSRLGYSSGKKTGLDIVIENKRIVTRFFNVFEDTLKRKLTITMDSAFTLERNRWYHYMITYDRRTGSMSTLIDGRETQKIYLTEDKRPAQGGYMPSFSPVPGGSYCPDLPVVFIGKDYNGYLDELKVSIVNVERLKEMTDPFWKRYKNPGVISRSPHNNEGLVTSPVYSFTGTGTRITKVSWLEKLQKHTYIWVEFRMSDSLFYENDINLPWHRIKNGERKMYLHKLKDGSYLRGKYYQWRAHLISSPDGKRAPVLSRMAINYHRDLAPRTPLFLESREAGHESFTLRWMKNIEGDLGGYTIYYGIEPGIYDGVIRKYKGSPITNSLTKGNYISLVIDNSVIEENMSDDSRGILTYPRLRNDVLYFFAISAYDSYRINSGYNHESPVSKAVTIRPTGGTDIK